MTEISVIHIAFRDYGIAPFDRFIRSYRRFASGIDHELVIALKGFANLDDAKPFLDLAEGIRFVPVFVPDQGFDLGTYFHVYPQRPSERFCFLNSNAEPLAPDWLRKLSNALDTQNMGLVGATGSFESLASDCLRELKGGRSLNRRNPLRGWLAFLRLVRNYPRFPNPHIRTNAFLIRRETLDRLAPLVVRDKTDAWRFESGRRSLTAQVIDQGLKIALVDSLGKICFPDDWPSSRTFRSGDQSHLLVADNQTRAFAEASAETRASLSSMSWERPT